MPGFSASDSNERPSTPLGRFIATHRVKRSHLARKCRYSRQHLAKIISGKQPLTRRARHDILPALRELANRPDLTESEAFGDM